MKIELLNQLARSCPLRIKGNVEEWRAKPQVQSLSRYLHENSFYSLAIMVTRGNDWVSRLRRVTLSGLSWQESDAYLHVANTERE